MSRSKVEGTKIAQAAKDLNVTSVTIRRYIQEFEINTDTDENGIKVLPAQALLELQEIRRLKEDGLTNPKVMELLEELRSKKAEAKPAKSPRATRAKVTSRAKIKEEVEEIEKIEEIEEEEEVATARPKANLKSRGKTISSRGKKAKQDREEKPAEEEEEESKLETAAELSKNEDEGEVDTTSEDADGERSKHALTCQTCGKNFEHMNPRLRDCLDCYRAKRKERRRGSDKHKRVIENPIAQQVLSRQAKVEGLPLSDKAASPAAYERPERSERPERTERPERPERAERPERTERPERADRNDRAERLERQERLERERQEARAIALASQPRHQDPTPWAQMQKPVRSYRKAIEETRLITGSLKRRLERPDLPEGERRWLEQVYAYQLILHQGWRHLAEYKSGGVSSTKTED